MPRPNQPRSIASEQHVAQRIGQERERRGMSYEALAIQMKHHGCPINASALFRIEKGDPPRRITVDEFVAFSEVFGLPVEELLLPPELAASREAMELVLRWDKARRVAEDATAERDAAFEAMKDFIKERPEQAAALEQAVEGWTENYFEEERRDAGKAWQMLMLTGDEKWGAVIDEAMEHRRALRGHDRSQAGRRAREAREKRSRG